MPSTRCESSRWGPDGNGNQSWNYTPDGLPLNVTTYNDAATTVVVNAYVYNKRRLLVEESVQQSGYTWTMGYGYDANGVVASVLHPGGEAITFTPNALGQARQAASQFGTYANGASYYPNGALKQFTYGNGIVHSLVQNARGLPERSMDAYGGTAVLDDSYDYDANGNVVAISDGLPGNRGNRDMTYDGLDRLRTASSPMFGADPLMEYSYDGLDNLKRVKGAGKDLTYVYDGANRLTNVVNTVGGATVVGLGYDVQGNLANKNGQAYGFDYGNRLRYSSAQESYRYDANGRRVSAFTPSPDRIEIRSFYDARGVLRYQQDFRRSKVLNYVYFAGSLVGQREMSMGASDHVLKFQHTDALGSPVATTDADRNVLERSEYSPFGALLNRSITDGPGYTGHVMDAATGLTYMQQRYYDPQIGRFLSVDPIAASSGTGANFNRYWYGNNNPYKFADPDGRKPRDRGAAYIGDGLVGGGGGGPGRVPCMDRPEICFGLGNGDVVHKPTIVRGKGGSEDKRLFMLPQNDDESGFYNYGTPTEGAGQYGRGRTLSMVFKMAHTWRLNSEPNAVGVGNISLREGGPFPPHAGHQKGFDVDMRPMNRDGSRMPVNWRSSNYDRAATQRLVDVILSTGMVDRIFFNDPDIEGVSPMRGHDDHLHVRVKP